MTGGATAVFDPARLGPPVGARIAVVGGAGGMGSAVVRALLATGVEPVVLDRAAALAENPTAAWPLAIEGADERSVGDAFAAIGTRWGRLDGYVNLAGFVNAWRPVGEMLAPTWDEVIDGNLRTHFLCARAALPLLRVAGGGAMVIVSSTLGMDVHPGYVHYASAKAALIALAKGLARENAPAIRVNAIAPGITRTAFLSGGTGRERHFADFDPDRYASRVPLQRVAEPEDIAGPILFLLGEAARYITGATLVVDGGVYQH